MTDKLEAAARAVRETPVDASRAAETRAKMLAAARAKRGVSRRRLGPWLVPIAAAFVASAALAGAGARLGWFSSPVVSPPSASVEPAAAPAPPRRAVAVASKAQVDEVALPAPRDPVALLPSTAPPPALSPPVPLAIEAPAAPTEFAPAAPRASSHAPSVDPSRPLPRAVVEAPPAQPTAPVVEAPPPPAPVAPLDPADELYRAAHDLHFRGGSASAAVAAWDRYLAAAPAGRFALEATYNRAIALLRAGRRAEGLAALRPFAEGAHGAYRRDEAKRLLDAAADAGAP